MNHAMQLRLIEEVQAVFPPELVSAMWLSRVGEHNIDELHARSLTIFSPVYLPIFERNGDLYCIHLVPRRPWERSEWIELPHDEADPILVATGAMALAAGLLTPPHWFDDRLDDVWAFIERLAQRFPTNALTKEDFLRDHLGVISFLRAKYDPDDGAAQTGWALSDPEASTEDEDVLARIESVLARMPDDHFAQAVVAIVRASLGRDDAAALARRALAHEFAWSWRHIGDYNMRRASAVDVLERVRVVAVAAIDEDDPFSPARTSSFKSAQGAVALRTIAERLRASGDERGALDQLRNGALVAGVTGQLTGEWCQALAEQTHRVAPGDPAALLAEHAAMVIHLGG